MDAERFDAITRLAATSSRRRFLTTLVGGVTTSLGLLRARAASAEEYYEERGQACGGYLDCNSPCRICYEGRCVYACPNATHTCDAKARTCPGFELSKGCCVCR